MIFLRYVIVCLIKGKALEFHEQLVKNICANFNVKRQRLPGHFTIKAPFETDNIEEIENIVKEFSSNFGAFPIKLEGFGHFRQDVVFIDIKVSDKAKEVHDSFIDKLKAVKNLEWKRNEGKNRVFHCTLVSKLDHNMFDSIWDYVSSFECSFKENFDNISILRWDGDKWITYKEYKLLKK